MKKFVLWMLMVCMLITMSMANLTIAVATEASGGADSYFLKAEGWPIKHWCFMTAEEIAAYEALGWKRETGVLWYDSERYVVEFDEIDTADIQEMYNEGYTFHVLYTWTCPANKLNKYTEQSVSVGYWMLSPEQAKKYHEDYVVPEIVYEELFELPSAQFMSQWYYDGQACSTPDIELTEDTEKYVRVRYVYDMHDFGFGSRLYLRNGDNLYQTYKQALDSLEASTYAENELPVWNGVRD